MVFANSSPQEVPLFDTTRGDPIILKLAAIMSFLSSMTTQQTHRDQIPSNLPFWADIDRAILQQLPPGNVDLEILKRSVFELATGYKFPPRNHSHRPLDDFLRKLKEAYDIQYDFDFVLQRVSYVYECSREIAEECLVKLYR